MPKKSNTKRSDGRIAVQVYLGRVDGKRKYKTVYGSTQKEADQKAEELKVKINKGIDIAKETDTFTQWADRWFSIKKSDIGNSQTNAYKSYLKHLKSAIGNLQLKDINVYDIQQLITDLYKGNPNTGKPTSKKVLTEIKGTASQVFRFAIENRAIEFNPAEYVRIPKNAEKTSRRALTKEERKWIEETEHRMQPAAMLMLHAGLRRQEVIPLLWSDIDLKNGTISVNKAIEFISGKPHIKSTKTKAGVRTVYISDYLVNHLKTMKKNNVLVCPSLSGQMHTEDTWRKNWHSYILDLDIKYGKYPQRKSKNDPRFTGVSIENITPHMLRHTFCTMMYENGVDVMTAKNQMGHADIQTTLSIYTHISADHTAEEMKKMNQDKNEMQVRCKS